MLRSKNSSNQPPLDWVIRIPKRTPFTIEVTVPNAPLRQQAQRCLFVNERGNITKLHHTGATASGMQRYAAFFLFIFLVTVRIRFIFLVPKIASEPTYLVRKTGVLIVMTPPSGGMELFRDAIEKYFLSFIIYDPHLTHQVSFLAPENTWKDFWTRWFLQRT